MVNIVIDDKIPFIRGVLESYANVCYLSAKDIARQQLANVDALVIRTRTRCNAELLDGTAVKFIASATIGYDHIDTEYCEEKGLKWTNAAGCNASSVEQYILAALLEIANKRNFQLSDKTIGIVGVGNVGSEVARVAQILGMDTMLCDPPRAKKRGSEAFVSLNELVEKADIITIHVSLSCEGADKTYGLFNPCIFSKIKKDTIFINTSRGEVVDEVALKGAINNGLLSDVVLDVWCNEPNVDTYLLNKVSIATPHIAGYSVDGKAMGTAMSVNALSRFFGWDLSSWFPSDLPMPKETLLTVDFARGTFEQNLYKTVKHTYDIMSDHNRLKMLPDTFEEQRGSYPLRRQFTSYTVDAKGITKTDRQKLNQLGFQLV
ncbi:MAG: 4-phosphoerythronate dehydrogenase [Prevotellaceae bacterium]|jgi:erythronate-4-phosphate dehydrogenase|nr:4-phosphoerythronate dehydrogenase [Prevotellaceae bacterium]